MKAVELRHPHQKLSIVFSCFIRVLLNEVYKQACQQSLSMCYLSLQTIQSEVRHVMTSVRSYISLLTSILGDCAGRGRQLLITLRNCEDKCTTLLE